MKNWNYIEDSELRNLIDNANNTFDYSEIVKEIYNICNRYLRIFEKDDDIYIDDLFDFINLIEDETDVLVLQEMEEDIENYGFDNIEDLLDDRLYQFWDLMDIYNIWIKL